MKKPSKEKERVLTRTGKIERHVIWEEQGLNMFYIYRNREYWQVVPNNKSTKAKWVMI